MTYTTAPKDYDWFGTETVEAVAGRDKRGRIIRKVRGPESYVEAQRARYGSGLHMAVDEPEWKKLVAYKLVTTEAEKHGDVLRRGSHHGNVGIVPAAGHPSAARGRSRRPSFYECGICDQYHPASFTGDCRDDANRFFADELDARYGTNGWKEVPMPGGEPGFRSAR